MFARLRCDRGGNVAIEFALIAPILLLMLAAVIDIGSAGVVRLRLNEEATAAADYTLLQSAPQESDAARALAETLVGLLQTGGTDFAEVVVNNAATAQWTDGGVTTSTGGSDPAKCYCPSRSEGTFTWGAAFPCSARCATGETAGKFVEIQLAARYMPLFSGHDFFEGDMIQVGTVVRLP